MTRPLLLFAPGAGASSTHPWMRHWSGRLATLGMVHTLDYGYMQDGRRRPDPLPRLIATHREALATARALTSATSTFLAGKSMGGRIGCHVALTEAVQGIICFGYPLCGGGDRARLRNRVLLDLRTPVLFVQGTRDPLCPLDLLEEVRATMEAPTQLHMVEGGDHSLLASKKVLKLHNRTQLEVDDGIQGAIERFITPLANM